MEIQKVLMSSESDDLAVSVFDVANTEDNIIIEGSLIKRNWYNKL